MGQAFSPSQVAAKLEELPGWSGEAAALVRTWLFPDFVQAIAFVNEVARVAELFGHHPDIEVHYNRLTLRLWTHTEGAVTAKDFELASRIDAIR